MKSMDMEFKASWNRKLLEKSVGFVVHRLHRNKWGTIFSSPDIDWKSGQ